MTHTTICPNCAGEGSTGLEMTASGVGERVCMNCNGRGRVSIPGSTPMFIKTIHPACPWIFAYAEVKGTLAKVSNDPNYGTFYAAWRGNDWQRIEHIERQAI